MSSIKSIISKEAAGITADEVDYVSKVASNITPALLTGALGLGSGLLGGYYYGSGITNTEKQELEEKATRNALLGGTVGALGALTLRKPVRGMLAPDPDDMVVLNDEEFDDLWKQRKRLR
jgi:hypothetical protein